MAQYEIPVSLIVKRLSQTVGQVREDVQKTGDVLFGPLQTDIGTTPHDIVYQEDRMRLKHYRPTTEQTVKTPLLIVYALINRETMLDLQPGRSVVQNLLQEGIDVYMIDWGYPTHKDRFTDMDDHVNGYMNNVVDFIRKRHNISKINLMGVCMGGTFSIMYSALHPRKIKNLITTVTPSRFDTDKGLLNIWSRDLDVDKIIDNHGNFPGDLLNMAFLLLNPARLMIDKYMGFLENMENKNFVENFVRMEKWIFDSPDVPGETFREFIKYFYKEDRLIKNKMELGGRKIDLRKLTMPLLNIYGRFDHLVPPESSEELPEKVGSKDAQNHCLNTGHIGIYVSSKSQKEFTPKIGQFLRERDAPAKKSGGRKKSSSSGSSAQQSKKQDQGSTEKSVG
jgi:polyhydroxyalkanoate synthase